MIYSTSNCVNKKENLSFIKLQLWIFFLQVRLNFGHFIKVEMLQLQRYLVTAKVLKLFDFISEIYDLRKSSFLYFYFIFTFFFLLFFFLYLLFSFILYLFSLLTFFLSLCERFITGWPALKVRRLLKKLTSL